MQISEALRVECARQAELVAVLRAMDEDVAKAAQAAFENSLGAALWLISPAMALDGRIPVEVAKTKEGKAETLRALIRIERNLAS